MIRLENVSKRYRSGGRDVPILRNINLTVTPGQRMGILGRNGAGKSTLIRLISGAEAPTSGIIHRHMSVSWPLAFGGAFLGKLTGYDNFNFICRLYNVDPRSKIDYIEEFSELGRYLREPLQTYSSGMRARLAFAVSMAVEFDCFLIDEVIAVGDSRFQAKCFDELFVKRADRALLIVSHHADFVREVCTSASVLESGVLRSFASVDDAYQLYSMQQAVSSTSLSPASDHGETVQDTVAAVEAEVEAAKGETMENRSQSLATMFLGLAQHESGDDLLPAAMVAFATELSDLSLALRVVDHVRASGFPEIAVRIMMELEPVHGSSSLFHVVMGDLLTRTNRDIPAIAAYRQAGEIDSESFWAHRNLGIALFNIGCYAAAKAAFDKAVHLPCPAPLKMELARHLIDCAAYLDEPAPNDIVALVPRPGDTIEDVTAVHYPNLGLLSVRVHGFRTRDGSQHRHLHLTINAGGQLYRLPVKGPGWNAFRRYAALAGCESYGAELVVTCADAPESVSVGLFEVETELVSSSDISVQYDGRSLPTASAQADDYASMAAIAYCLHDFAACILFSNLGQSNGITVDYEAFAESLIALGRYHEAEHLLAELLSDENSEGLDGKLFDLLCAEIGRSRLPGWQARLDRLIADRLVVDENDGSAYTNAGHLQVSKGRTEAAVELYSKAANALVGQEVIHFNRGIFSSQFIEVGEMLPLPETVDSSDSDELVHLVSCDATYFKRYGAAVVRSSRTTAGHERTLMHVHIVDPDAEALELARKLQNEFAFNVTTEFVPMANAPRQVKVAYYTSARFISLPRLLEIYKKPILVTETDCLINWSWDEIIGWCKDADFGSVQSSLTNFVPWTRIPAGIAYFDAGTKGKAMAAELQRFLERLFLDPSTHAFDLWTIDQVALWIAWQGYGRQLNAVHLPMYSMLRLATGDKTNIL